MLAVDWRRRAKEHWTLQTESLKIESRVHLEIKFKQFLTRSELQIVPSFVHTQVTQGDMFSDRPNSINFLLIIHFVPRSLQWFKSRLGKLSQGIRGFLFWDKHIFVTFRTHQILIQFVIVSNVFWLYQIKRVITSGTYRKGSGRSIAMRWMAEIESEFWQINLDSDVFRISVNWDSVNRMNGSLVSCQKRSHFLNFSNCVPITQPNVGPTDPPWSGFSINPPVNRSMSSTDLSRTNWIS